MDATAHSKPEGAFPAKIASPAKIPLPWKDPLSGFAPLLGRGFVAAALPSTSAKHIAIAIPSAKSFAIRTTLILSYLRSDIVRLNARAW